MRHKGLWKKLQYLEAVIITLTDEGIGEFNQRRQLKIQLLKMEKVRERKSDSKWIWEWKFITNPVEG